MAVSHKPVTAQTLLEIPNDGLRRELVCGEVRTTAPAGSAHGRIAINVAWSLTGHARSRDLGVVFAAKTGFKIASTPDTMRSTPDAAFVRRERVEAVGEIEGYWPGGPDLAVEVISPNVRFAEVEEKVESRLVAETRMVVVVNPRGKSVTVWGPEGARMLSGEEVIDGGEVVPGWTLPVADVFR